MAYYAPPLPGILDKYPHMLEVLDLMESNVESPKIIMRNQVD